MKNRFDFKFLILHCLCLAVPFTFVYGQQVKDFLRVPLDGVEIPVLVRGNLSNQKLLLFVQGGPGETAIDFARADYPGWKETLEKAVVIAYYDQRGLNQRAGKIDSTTITYTQYGLDMLALASHLKNKYDTDIYLMGHSAGGSMVLHTLKTFPEKGRLFEGALVLNTPITTNYSPERNTIYRPLYLRNLALEQIRKGREPEYWGNALDWMDRKDSLSSREDLQFWRETVEHAFVPRNKTITPGMVLNVIFSRPYNPVRYLNRKDNKRVEDLLWYDEKTLSTFEGLERIQLPVLLLTGRYDDVARKEELEEAHERMPHSKLAIIPRAAHESFLDQPELFAENVLSFVLDSRE